MTLRRLERIYPLLALLAVLAWIAVAFGGMPEAIRAAHAGGGIAVLRRAMSEAATRPLAAYLDAGDEVARLSVYYLCIGLAVGYVVLRLASVSRQGEGNAGPAAPCARSSAAILLGLWFGLLSGFGEGLYVALRTGLLRRLVPAFNEANLTTALLAPVTNALLFAAIGALIAVLAGRRKPALAVRIATVTFTGLTVTGWSLLPGRVSWVAGAVLGAGAAVQAGRLVTHRSSRFVRYAHASVGRGVALLGVLAGLQVAVPRLWAARVNARLVPTPDRPGVLWIVLDTERAGSLELYGRARRTTPFLTRLARESVVFDRAIAPSSWTLPSHESFFTGLRGRDVIGWGRLAPGREHPTIAEVFREHGYRTAGIAGNLVFLNPWTGLSRGFTEWSATIAKPRTLLATTWVVRTGRMLFRKLRPAPYYLVERDAASVSGAAERWLARHDRGRPFFLFLDYFDAHGPFRARPASLPEANLPERMFWYAKGTDAAAYSQAELALLRDAYESEIAALDRELENLFAWLSDRDLIDGNIVVITADHGEHFGEHGLLDHGNSLYLPLIHVPLLVRLPRGEHGGLRIAEPVEVRDVAATLLDVAGIDGTGFPGTSLARFWTAGTGRGEPVFASVRGWETVLSEGYQLVVTAGGTEELYRDDDEAAAVDLAARPELTDVIGRLRMLLSGKPR